MMEYPGATLFTLLDYMEDPEDPKYLPYINRLDQLAAKFLQTQLPNKQFNQTRQEIVRRLYQVLENNTFKRLPRRLPPLRPRSRYRKRAA
jgi:hypothetical protein